MNTNPFFSHKYAVSFSIIIYLAVVFIIDYKTIQNEQMMADENITNRLMLGALQVESVLPRHFHHQKMINEKLPDTQHLEYTFALNKISQLFRLRYVYSLVLINDETLFTSGSAFNKTSFANKTITEPLVGYLEKYDDAPEELKNIFVQNKPLFLEYKDRFGQFKSVFIPRISPDGTLYIVAADVEQTYIKDIKNQIILDNTLLLIPLLVFIAIVISLINSQTRQLRQKIQQRTDELKEAYTIDKLTGLPNRLQLFEVQKEQESSSLALINIDRFNEINEIYGNHYGDQVLQFIAQEMCQWAEDKPVDIFKSHADEFAVLINKTTSDLNMTDQSLVESIFSHWIIELLDRIRVKKIHISEQVIQVTASSGIVVNSHNSNTEADRALRKAKKELSEYYVYNDSLSTEDNYLNNRKMLEMIKVAISSNNIKTYFQPILDVKTQTINKHEALIRMYTNDGEIISPFFFIGIARKSKLYPALTKIMFDHVLEILTRREDLTLSVNISFDDISNKDTRLYIIQQLLTFKPKGKLVFELLESDEIDNFKLIEDFMIKLNRLNVEFSIDDFGSGFSNYSRLSKLPISYLKIDGSLIKDMLENQKHRIIVQSIIDSAHQLGYLTIAEFVENEALANALTEMKVDFLQGYHIGKPEPHHFD